MDWWVECQGQMVRKLNCDHQGLDQHGTQTQMHHQRPEVGCHSASRRVQKQSLLRLVWRSDRVHFDHSQPVGTRLPKVVEEQQRQSVPVHGQGQHSFPHSCVPFESDRLRNGLDVASPHFDHWVPELWIGKVFKEKRNRGVWWCCCWNRNPCRSLALLLADQQALKVWFWVQLEGVCRQKQQWASGQRG